MCLFTRNLFALLMALAVILSITSCTTQSSSSQSSKIELAQAAIQNSVVTVYSFQNSNVGSVQRYFRQETSNITNDDLTRLIQVEKDLSPDYYSQGQPRWSELQDAYEQQNRELYRALRSDRGRVHYIAAPAGSGKSFVARALERDAASAFSEVLRINLGPLFRSRQRGGRLGEFYVQLTPDLVVKQLQGGTIRPDNELVISWMPGIKSAGQMLSSPRQRAELLALILSLPDEANAIKRGAFATGGRGRLIIIDSLDEVATNTATAMMMAMLDAQGRPGPNDVVVVLGRGESIATARPYLDSISGFKQVLRDWELATPTIQNRAELGSLLQNAIAYASEIPPAIAGQPEKINRAEDILDRWMTDSHEIRSSMTVLQHSNWIIGEACRIALGDGGEEPDPWAFLSGTVFGNQLDRGRRTHGRPDLRGDPAYLAMMYAAARAYTKNAIDEGEGWFQVLPHRPVVFEYNDAVYSVDASLLLDHSGFVLRDPLYIHNSRQRFHPMWMMRAWLQNAPQN